MIPVGPRVRRPAGDTNGGGRRTRDGASWLALTNIGSGRYVPFSENPPGQPVALECPQRPRGSVRPAAEFVRQFCLRRQLGPRRVFAAPDPPHEHGVNVLVGPRVLPRIIHDQSHGQCNDPSPDGLLVFHLEHPRVAAPTDVYARVTPSPGRRHERVSLGMVVMYKYAGLAAGCYCSRGLRSGCRRGGSFRLAARISALGAQSTDARIWQVPLSRRGTRLDCCALEVRPGSA